MYALEEVQKQKTLDRTVFLDIKNKHSGKRKDFEIALKELEKNIDKVVDQILVETKYHSFGAIIRIQPSHENWKNPYRSKKTVPFFYCNKFYSLSGGNRECLLALFTKGNDNYKRQLEWSLNCYKNFRPRNPVMHLEAEIWGYYNK